MIIIGVNEPFMKLFKYEHKSDIIGKPLIVIMPPEFAQVHDKIVQNYLENGVKRVWNFLGIFLGKRIFVLDNYYLFFLIFFLLFFYFFLFFLNLYF